MREKTLGKIYMIIGIYLSIINPILSMIFNQVYTVGFHVTLDPLTYWSEWLWRYGFFIILLAGLGVYLIIIGYHYIIRSTKD